MNKLVIEGGRELSGEIHIGGAKNSIVALIPASILTSGKCIIKNVPDISDVHALIEIMEELGSKIYYQNEIMEIDNSNVQNKLIKEEFTTKLRASYYFMASLLGKYKKAEISYPGGCVIGSRPIDFTLNSFKKMGVNIKEVDGHYNMKTNKLEGTEIFFDVPSVGATINVMISAVLAEGKTRILNAAREPEIVNVADFLISMGANIKGAGTGTIEITGVKKLGDGEVTVIPDRIEAGTYIIIGALLFYDRRLLLKADFMLLLTFVAFFVFSGNLARIEAVSFALRNLLNGREYLVSLLTSQIISNVPAALLLSGFTGQSHAVLLGVNVGGLGTPIASLASLISMKLYSHSEHSSIGHFLAEFLAVNIALLLILFLIL